MNFGIVTAKIDESATSPTPRTSDIATAWSPTARYLESGEEPEHARPTWKAYLEWLDQAPPAVRHQRLHGSHYSFLDAEEARFITPELVKASCLVGVPEEMVEKVRALERQGLRQITLYPPLNRQYRVIEDFADTVMSRL